MCSHTMTEVSAGALPLESIDGRVIYKAVIIIPTGLEKLLQTTDASVLSKLKLTQPFSPEYTLSKSPT